jgi:hypothetical protein
MAREVQYVTKGGRSGLYLTDYNDLIKELNRVQPTLVKQLQRDYRKIAKPVKTAIQNVIPLTPPLSGFTPKTQPGRVTWGANYQNKNKDIKDILVQTPSPKKAPRTFSRNKTDVASVGRLMVQNAGVVLADMAGRTGNDINKYAFTREYDYSRSRTGKRKHRVNGQGRIMINRLNKRLGRNASRFIYKGVDASRPKAIAQSKLVLQKAFSVINKRMVD